MTLAATASHAQDLLARQAPIDRKARALDTLYLQRIIEEEMEESIAAHSCPTSCASTCATSPCPHPAAS